MATFEKNRIYVEDNYFFIRSKEGELLSDHKSDVTVNPTSLDENEWDVTSPKIGTKQYKVDDIENENGNPYTAETFKTFYTQNTGFNPDSGGSESIPLSEKGAPNGVATLDGGGQVPLAQIPASIKGGIKVVGFWDANTNTPDLSLLTLNQGEAYIVSVSGSTNINGETNWKTKDMAVWDDTLAGNWFKLDNTDDVLSVVGKTGVVTLDIADISGLQAALDSIVSANGPVTTHNDVTSAGSGEIITSSERTNLNNQSNTNTGDETTATIQTKRPLKTINSNTIEGSGDLNVEPYYDRDIPGLYLTSQTTVALANQQNNVYEQYGEGLTFTPPVTDNYSLSVSWIWSSDIANQSMDFRVSVIEDSGTPTVLLNTKYENKEVQGTGVTVNVIEGNAIVGNVDTDTDTRIPQTVHADFTLTSGVEYKWILEFLAEGLNPARLTIYTAQIGIEQKTIKTS